MAVSTLDVLITGNAAPLQGALVQAGASVKGFEGSMSRVGTTAQSALGRIVPLSATAAGIAIGAFAKQSFDAAVSFERSFTQIAALTNSSASQVDAMRESVLRLAGDTAQAPADLAKAMYFLASSGLDATQQSQALEAAAKGAAVGLGQAGDIARITANALNVFGDNGLQAVDVVDTLVAAVREGSAEPDEFADALGRVLPIADKAGISFQQVAASLATMSNAGLDVNEGVTALRGTLQSLVAPTNQTQDALASIGLTVDDVVGSLQQQGLIATLRQLDAAARANTQSTGEYNILMRNLVPNVRALTGVFNLTSQSVEKVDAIFRSVVQSKGSLDRAFEITTQSAAFKYQKALNDISIAGQKLAIETLPLVAQGLSLFADQVTRSSAAVDAFRNKDLPGVINGIGQALNASSFLTGFQFPEFITDSDVANFQQKVDEINLAMAQSSITVEQKAQVTQQALSEIGGSLNSDNIDEYGAAIRHSLAVISTEAAVAQSDAQAFDELAAKHQEAKEATDSYRRSVAALTAPLDQLSAIGIDAASFLDDFRKKLEDADDPMTAFADGLGEIQAKAKAWLTQTANSITGIDDVLSTLANDSSLTTQEVENAFQRAAQAARAFTADLVTISKTGGQTGRDLANKLLELGPQYAGLANFIAGQSKQMRNRLIGDFGDVVGAGKTGASRLQGALVPVLTDIRDVLVKIARKWGIVINLNDNDAQNGLDNLRNKLNLLPGQKVIDVIVHTKSGSPWPDEALKMHLTDPLAQAGFKRVGDSYTLPLDVTAHSTFDPITPPGAKDGSSGGSLRHLTRIEADSLGILKDIKGLLRTSGGGGGGGGDGVSGSLTSGGGGGGGTASVSASLDDAVHRVVKLLDKSGVTQKETMGVIRKVAQQGSDAAFIKKSVAQVADELGKHTAALYGRALRKLDDATLHSDAKRAALIKAALEAHGALEAKRANRDPLAFLGFALQNAPKLPQMPTHIDPNLHHRDEGRARRHLYITRQHLDDQLAFQESYRGY